MTTRFFLHFSFEGKGRGVSSNCIWISHETLDRHEHTPYAHVKLEVVALKKDDVAERERFP